MSDLRVEPTGTQDFGPCDCCGKNARTVWGFIHRAGEPTAAYFVHWAPGKVASDGAAFDFVVGAWGASATAADRRAVSLALRSGRDGPAFMVVDAAGRRVAKSELVGTALSREDVVGTVLADEVFQLADAVWLQDDRIAEITGRAV